MEHEFIKKAENTQVDLSQYVQEVFSKYGDPNEAAKS